jgi:hypothetical protein
MERKPEFAEAIKRAEDEGNKFRTEYAVASILKAMDKNWTAGAWWLERTSPDKYAQHQKVEHSGGSRLIIQRSKKPYDADPAR